MSWDLYKVASGLHQKEEKIQVATLLHVLGKECVEFFSNFVWTSEGDRDKIEAEEEKFNSHCAPLTARHFNSFLFIEQKQHEGETVDEFCSDLKTLANMVIKKIRGLRLCSCWASKIHIQWKG